MLKLTTPSSILFWDPTKLESYEFEAPAYEESIKLAVSDCTMDDFSDLMVQLGMSATTLSPIQCHMVKSLIAFERAFPSVIDNLSVIEQASTGIRYETMILGWAWEYQIWARWDGKSFSAGWATAPCFTSLYNCLAKQYLDAMDAKAKSYGDRYEVLGVMIQQEVAW